MRRQPATRQSGFTIIEMLIVLAVGSLILMIIFLAIPALQRNSRNNQRNQDVQTILSAVSQWQLNHSGNIPADIAPALQASRAKLTAYESANVAIQGNSSGSPATIAPKTDIEKVDIYNYQKCNPSTAGGSTATGAGYSDIVALYALEKSSGTAGKCQQL